MIQVKGTFAEISGVRGGPWVTRNMAGGGLNTYHQALDALDAGGSGIRNIVLLSASDGEGYSADETVPINNLVKGFAGLLNSAHARRYQDTGLGFIHAGALEYGGGPWTYDSYWQWYSGGYGIAGTNMYAATAGAKATFAFHGTGVTLVCASGSSTGAFTAKIDGVDKGSFNTYSVPLYGARAFVIAAAGTLTDSDHVLEITTSSTAIILIVGAYALTNATRGVRLIRGCQAGAPVQQFVWSEQILYAEIDVWNPALTIIAIIANDVAAGTAVSTFKTHTQTLITRAKTFGSVLLYADWPRPDKAATAGDAYVVALQELSDTNNIPLIDMMTPYKGQLVTLGYVAGDNIHPNAAGHQLLYRPLAQSLLGAITL
ncbi:MAG: SGNH/GDSL hydrolase family protein [Bacillota bacterium]